MMHPTTTAATDAQARAAEACQHHEDVATAAARSEVAFTRHTRR
jgi:hypothetical protein